MARALGVLFLSGATLALSGVLLLNLPDATSVPANLAIVGASYCGGAILLAAGGRTPLTAIQAFLALGTVCVTLGVHYSGDAATSNQVFYTWVGLYAGFFLSRRAMLAQLAFVGLAYAAELALTQPGNEAVVHWLITLGAVGVVTSVVASLADRADTVPPRTAAATDGPAVAFVSLSRFDEATAALDPSQRERLLALVAGRLRASLGPNDGLAPAGDATFAATLHQDGGASRVTELEERIGERLRAPFLLDGRTVDLGAAVELTYDESTPLARGGPAGVARDLELRLDLGRAIERDEFEVHYQLKVSIRTGRVVGIEALVRWRHPRLGLVAPAEFIPAAEDCGAIVPLGRIVLRRACTQARAWQTRFPCDPPLRLFVNVSSRQLQDDGIVREVSEALARSRLAPGSLALELTESAFADDLDRTSATLAGLKDLGVTLAVDDFGVGYSSLGLLRSLPVDALKIDRSFVGRMLDGPEDDAIVVSVLSLARALRLEVVAEGVERGEQLERLRELGCDMAQGFYFAPPLPAEKVAGAISARAA